MKWTHCGLRPPLVPRHNMHAQGGLAGGRDGDNSMFEMCSHSSYFYFLFCLPGSFLLALVFCLSLWLSLSLSLTLSFSQLFRVEGTSEGSGWLSLLEADGRPKARRPQFHEAWFEHARTMSRGMPMDDGYMVCVWVCVCVYVCICLIVCVFICLCEGERHFFCMQPDMFTCVLMHASALCLKKGETWLAGPPWQMKLDGLQAL